MNGTSGNRIASLDGLRAVSILFVISGHMYQYVIGLSIFGVHVFFVISGYLITRLLQQEYERNSRISLTAFYRRRCFRILPAAYTYIVVIALLSPTCRPGLLYAATYTVSYHLLNIPIIFQHLWSLSVEEQFYLLWPLAFVLGFRHRGRIACAAMLFSALFRLAVALRLVQYPTDSMHFSFPGTMDSLAAGCLLAIYETQVRKKLGWMCEPTAIAIALPVTAWTLGGLWWGDSLVVGVRVISAFWGVVPLLIAFWVFLLVERRDWIFNNPVARTIGVLSYSLYLWQQPFLVAYRFPKPLALVMLTGCAITSYFLVEKPMLRLGASLKSRRVVTVPVPANIQLPGTE